MGTKEVLIKELDSGNYSSDLIELSKDFFHEYENNNREYFGIDSIDEIDISNYFNNFIGKETSKAYIAIIDDKIIGYITVYIKNQSNYWVVKKIGDISGLMVNKNFRKNGIGSKLIKKAIEYLEQKDIKYYTVFTSVNNVDGITLYKKFGLEELCTTFYGRIK